MTMNTDTNNRTMRIDHEELGGIIAPGDKRIIYRYAWNGTTGAFFTADVQGHYPEPPADIRRAVQVFHRAMDAGRIEPPALDQLAEVTGDTVKIIPKPGAETEAGPVETEAEPAEREKVAA